MTEKKKELPLTSLIRALGAAGVACALVGAVSGAAMLLLMWVYSSAPDILTQLALILVPLAVLLLAAAIILAVARRRL